MRYVNLCPHTIHLMQDRWTPTHAWEPSGQVARCVEITRLHHIDDDVQVVTKQYGVVTGLPEPQPDTVYLVSGMVRMAMPERTDLASPGDAIRDEAGRIVGASNLVINVGG
jgi:hypothetical protein